MSKSAWQNWFQNELPREALKRTEFTYTIHYRRKRIAYESWAPKFFFCTNKTIPFITGLNWLLSVNYLKIEQCQSGQFGPSILMQTGRVELEKRLTSFPSTIDTSVELPARLRSNSTIAWCLQGLRCCRSIAQVLNPDMMFLSCF